MSGWRRERRRWVAILAAYALVLQALIGGAGAVAAAPAPMLDAFGGVICSFDGTAGHEAPADPGPHHRAIDCLSHCALASFVALAPAGAPALHTRLAWAAAVPERAHASADPGAPVAGPLGARGPPA
jgi:hypothetical protein